MAPVALAPRPRRTLLTSTSVSHNNFSLHPLTKREKLSKSNIITLAVFLVILLSILLFFGVFVPRWTRKKKLKERQQALREMLTAEERAASRIEGHRRFASQRQGQGQGQGQGGTGGGTGGGGESIPMDDMAVPDGDGGWVEPPPPYVADPKPAYHP